MSVQTLNFLLLTLLVLTFQEFITTYKDRLLYLKPVLFRRHCIVESLQKLYTILLPRPCGSEAIMSWPGGRDLAHY